MPAVAIRIKVVQHMRTRGQGKNLVVYTVVFVRAERAPTVDAPRDLVGPFKRSDLYIDCR